MPMTYVSTKVTQHKVTFETAEDNKVEVLLTDHYGWNLTIPNQKNLTIKEMIEICELLYSKEIVRSDQTIAVYLKGTDPIYVRGNRRITEAFIESISVAPSDTTERK